MRPWLKKTLIASGAAMLLVIALLVAGAAYLNTAAMRERLLAAVNGHIRGRLSLADHHISLLSGKIRLAGAVLTDEAGQPVLSIESLQGRVFWPALARRTVHIASLAVEQSLLDLRHDAQDQLNILRILNLGEPGGAEAAAEDRPIPFQVYLEDLQWQLEKIFYQRSTAGLAVEGHKVAIRGGGDSAVPDGDLELKVGRLAVQAPDVDQRLENLALSAAYQPKRTPPITLALTAGQSRVTLEGRIDPHGDSYQMAADAQLDLSLSDIQPWLPASVGLRGRAAGHITAQGALADPQAAVDLTVVDGAVTDLAVQRLHLEARLAQRQVALKLLQAQGPWGDVELSGDLDLRPLFPQSLADPSGSSDGLAYRGALIVRELIPQRIQALPFPLEGKWQGPLTIKGKGFDPGKMEAEAEVDLKVAGLRAFEGAPGADGSLTGAAQWRSGRLLVSRLAASLGQTTVQATGELDTTRRTFATNAAVSSAQLARLGDFFDIYLPEGSATAKLHGQGPWQHPQAHLDLRGANLSMAGWRFGELTATADLGADGVIQVPNLVLKHREGTLQGNGRLRLFKADGDPLSDPGFALNLDGRRLNLGDFYAGLPVNMLIAARLRAGGTFGRPTAALELADSPVRWRDLDLSAKGAAAWADGRLTISALRLAKGRSAADFKGSARWQDKPDGPWRDDPLLTAELKATTLYLEDFLPKSKGPLALAAEVKGPATRLKGTFHLDGKDLRLRGQALESIALSGRLEAQTLRVERLAVALAPRQELTGSGWYAFDERFGASLRADNLDLRHVAVLQRAYPIDGRLNLSADAQGSLEHPQALAKVLIRKPLINGKAWDDFTVEAQLRDRQLSLAADLTFQLNGQARTDTGRFELTADFDQTDLAPYLALGLDDQWGGQLSGSLRASGDWHTPKALKADLTLRETHLSYQKSNLIGVDKLQVHMADGVVHLPQTRLTLLQQGYLTAAATGRLEKDIAASLTGRLPLAALAPFTDSVERASGELQIDLRAEGPWNAVQWQADLEPVEMGCIFTDLDQTVRHLNGRVRLNPRVLSVEGLSGMLDDGRFALNGTVALAEWQPTRFALTFSAQALPLHWPDTMDLTVGAELSLKGEAHQAMLNGQLVLLEGSYYKDVRYDLLSLRLVQPQRAEKVPETTPSQAWMHSTSLDLTVTHRYPFLVDNNLARLEIVPDLKLTGTAANPLIDGRAYVRSGEVLFQGRSFEVQRGVVDFLNPRRIEPTLDILAKAQIRQWMVSLSLTGTPDNLLLKLSSDPPESDANILSLILLGRTNAESAANTGEGSSSSKQMMASLMASTLSDDIKEKTGVDIFEMETGPTEDDDSEERVQLTVGKNLTPRLAIKYELETDDVERVQRAISEYRLLEHIVASGFQDTAGNYGGELIFRVQFR
jgi:autotransporter translocation and assembly factor TamB